MPVSIPASLDILLVNVNVMSFERGGFCIFPILTLYSVPAFNAVNTLRLIMSWAGL